MNLTNFIRCQNNQGLFEHYFQVVPTTVTKE